MSTMTMSEGARRVDVTDALVVEPSPGRASSWAARLVRDPRDVTFVWVTLAALLVLVPMGVIAYVPGVMSPLYALAYYAVLFAVFLDRYILMLHCTSHRRLFVQRLSALNQLIPLVLAPFMGQSPYTYFAHHMGMHHPENNLPDDLSSTMRYRRDSILSFLHYFGTFFFAGIFQLTRYHWKRKQMKLFRMAFFGELSWYALVIGLGFVSLVPTLVVFVAPFVLVRFLMMAGNWSQHAFIDARDPANPYVNSITSINTRYNRRCFNDGYHIGHHVKANRHWSEMPKDFVDNLARYRDEGAVVFAGVDYFQIWALLMFKRYDALARRYVDLGVTPKTHAEIVALLRERTRPILPAG